MDEIAGIWRDASGAVDRSRRGWVGVSGRDAARLLQGLVTNEVASLGVGESCYALVLTPKGRPLCDLWILREADDAFLLACEPEAHEVLAATVRRYRLASKAEIEDRRGTVGALALATAPDPLPPGTWLVTTPLGGELWGDPAALAELASTRTLLDHAAYESMRVEAGIPRHGVDFAEANLPAEAGLDATAISFAKGCYVGQEPVARLHYRGHPNRLLRRLLLEAEVLPPAAVVRDEREVGRLTSTARTADGRVVALGYLRREVADDDALTVGDGVAARVIPARP